MEKPLIVSSSPHVRTTQSTSKIMNSVVLALTPGALVGIYFFGIPALFTIILAIAGCLATEWACFKWMGTKGQLKDSSAVLTGLLLAMNLPSNSPWWMTLLGSAVAIFIGKQLYGGLGYNPFNPALVARVFLLIAFPVQMTTWPTPSPLFGGGAAADATTTATPLGVIKTDGLAKLGTLNYGDYLMGNVGGSLGEISAIALLIGGIYLIARRIITWHIPVSFLATTLIFCGIFWGINPQKYADPFFHLVTGGLVLGAFFMATDYVTSPMTPKGMLIFGIGCGLLTALIRLFGGYPEGVSFAILLMNAVTPLIDRYTQPTKFGLVVRKENA
ncbi:MAG: RnfABCDGE type electron transport complex subunit D [Nitrospirota bacterium]|nr:RnfABCDGE type electron transport complex subunit D [Nitrospirota bacterium]